MRQVFYIFLCSIYTQDSLSAEAVFQLLMRLQNLSFAVRRTSEPINFFSY